jgi:hypothetical protein
MSEQTRDEFQDMLAEIRGSAEYQAESLAQSLSDLAFMKAEIERLKEENAHFAWRDKDKNKIINELSDALKTKACWKEDVELIQRAREATKDE